MAEDINIFAPEITNEIRLIPKGEYVGVSFILCPGDDRLCRKEKAVTFWVSVYGHKVDRRQFAQSLRDVANKLEQLKED